MITCPNCGTEFEPEVVTPVVPVVVEKPRPSASSGVHKPGCNREYTNAEMWDTMPGTGRPCIKEDCVSKKPTVEYNRQFHVWVMIPSGGAALLLPQEDETYLCPDCGDRPTRGEVDGKNVCPQDGAVLYRKPLPGHEDYEYCCAACDGFFPRARIEKK